MNKSILNLNKWTSLLLTFFFFIGVNVHNIRAVETTEITWDNDNGWHDSNFKYKIDVDYNKNLVATVSECIGSPTALNIPNFLNYNNNITLVAAAAGADTDAADADDIVAYAAATDAAAAASYAAAADATEAAYVAEVAAYATTAAGYATTYAADEAVAAGEAANAAAGAAYVAEAAAYAAVATAIAYDHSDSEADRNAFGAATVALCAASQALGGNLLSNIKVTSIANNVFSNP